MNAVACQPARSGALFGARTARSRSEATSGFDDGDPCGGERIVDFALCLIAAAAVVGLLLMAL